MHLKYTLYYFLYSGAKLSIVFRQDGCLYVYTGSVQLYGFFRRTNMWHITSHYSQYSVFNEHTFDRPLLTTEKKKRA